MSRSSLGLVRRVADRHVRDRAHGQGDRRDDPGPDWGIGRTSEGSLEGTSRLLRRALWVRATEGDGPGTCRRDLAPRSRRGPAGKGAVRERKKSASSSFIVDKPEGSRHAHCL